VKNRLVQERDRRGHKHARRGHAGVGHADVLHQRTEARRRAGVREVQADHRRGDRAPARSSFNRASPMTALYGHADQGRERARGAGKEGDRRAARERAVPRSGEREGRDPAVQRFRMSVLRPRRAHGRDDPEDYPGKVKIVWRDKPLPSILTPRSPRRPRARHMRRKATSGFYKMHKLLFAGHQRRARTHRSRGLRAARSASIRRSSTRARQPRAQGGHRRRRQGGTDAGASGTPAFFVGPYFISGAQAYSKFKKVIDLALAGSSEARRSGRRGSSS